MKSQISKQSFGDKYYSDSDSESDYETDSDLDEDILYDNPSIDPPLNYDSDEAFEDEENEKEEEDTKKKGVVLILTPFGNLSDEVKCVTNAEEAQSQTQPTNDESVAKYWRLVRNRLQPTDRRFLNKDSVYDKPVDMKDSGRDRRRFPPNHYTTPEMSYLEKYYKRYYGNDRNGRPETGVRTQTANIVYSENDVIITPQAVPPPLEPVPQEILNNGIVTRTQIGLTVGRPLNSSIYDRPGRPLTDPRRRSERAQPRL